MKKRNSDFFSVALGCHFNAQHFSEKKNRGGPWTKFMEGSMDRAHSASDSLSVFLTSRES